MAPTMLFSYYFLIDGLKINSGLFWSILAALRLSRASLSFIYALMKKSSVKGELLIPTSADKYYPTYFKGPHKKVWELSLLNFTWDF